MATRRNDRKEKQLVRCECSICLRDFPDRPSYVPRRTATNHRIADLARRAARPSNTQQSATNVGSSSQTAPDDVIMDDAPTEIEDIILPVDEVGDVFTSDASDSEPEPEEIDDELDYLASESLVSSEETSSSEGDGVLSQHPLGFFIVFMALFQKRFLSERAAEILIDFIQVVLTMCGLSFVFPNKASTIYKWSKLEYTTQGMTRYVACGKCHSIYDINYRRNVCRSVQYPDHDWPSIQHDTCDHPLFHLSSGNQRRPRSVYCYNSLVHSLKIMFMRPDFEDSIEHWRRRTRYDGIFYDVFDGRMWSELKDAVGAPFVNMPRSLMLTLNVDWFQPYDNSPHSCGAIYLTINNLPRSVRNKIDNVILVGVIPGPREPSKDQMNNYLKPLVDELEVLFEGIRIPTAKRKEGAIIRAAILMIACDIPAARKVSGFTSFMSFYACHKCNRRFPSLPDCNSRDFSGFDDAQWSRRTATSNREAAERWKRARSATERTTIEQETGTRWSELHRLRYLDLVRCTTIDPMHNLFLGTAKRLTKLWLDMDNPHLPSRKLLTKAHIREMARSSARVDLPPSYSKFTNKIASGFSYLKADEWKTWCLALSPLLLISRLLDSYAINWIKFVDATRLLTRPSISLDEVDQAHDLLKEFLRGCEQLYGKKEITPNMHLHLHLSETIKDFGPVYSFWLFNFERYNGIVKDFSTNNRDEWITSTYMRQFMHAAYGNDYLQSLPREITSRSMVMKLLSRLVSKSTTSAQTNEHDFDLAQFLEYAESDGPVFGYEKLPVSSSHLETSKPLHMGATHYECLVEYYQAMYPLENFSSFKDRLSSTFVDDSIRKFYQIEMLGDVYNSTEYHRTDRGNHILAYSGVADVDGVLALCPARVLYYFKHVLRFESGEEKEHTFAFVQWFRKRTPSFGTFHSYGLDVWSNECYPAGKSSILPVHKIYSPAATMSYVDNTSVIIPLPRKPIINAPE